MHSVNGKLQITTNDHKKLCVSRDRKKTNKKKTIITPKCSPAEKLPRSKHIEWQHKYWQNTMDTNAKQSEESKNRTNIITNRCKTKEKQYAQKREDKSYTDSCQITQTNGEKKHRRRETWRFAWSKSMNRGGQ